MNNKVKLQAGMRFKDGHGDKFKLVQNKEMQGAWCVDYYCNDGNVRDLPYSDVKSAEFIPASDLEWLAVNATMSAQQVIKEGFKFITWIGGCVEFSKNDNYGAGLTYGIDCLIECRYKLGLDDRPQEEVKMLDLSGAMVGEKFESKIGVIFEIMIIGEFNLIVKSLTNGWLYTVTFKGFSREIELFKKHTPRPWLSQLPDAGLFDESIYSIRYEITCGWVFSKFRSKETWMVIDLITMPPINDGEAHLTGILISDLAKWQAENK